VGILRLTPTALVGILSVSLFQCGGDLPSGMSEKDGQLILSVTDSVELPVAFNRNFGSLNTEGESELKFRIQNSRSSNIGNGSINLKSGVASICSCDGGALNLGNLGQDGCLKIKISLDSSISGSQQAQLELLGILNITLSGSISTRNGSPILKSDPSNRDLNIGGDCGF